MISLVIRACSLLLLVPTLAYPAVLENPGHGGSYSGIGVVSGWKCQAAGNLTVVFNDDGKHIPLLYGSERTDVRDAGACREANVGFVTIWNWANLGEGSHTAVAYDNGKEFARSTFTVATLGEAFVEGASGECAIEDFPSTGETATFAWNQNTQHLELVPADQAVQNDGQCRAGLVVHPGESCTHPTNGETFSVDSSGRGSFMFFSAGTGINIVDSNINGQRITFVASRNPDDSWTVERVN